MAADRAHLLLIGFMGSGKSTIAPWLASGLGCPCWELDQRVVDRYGLSIPTLFQQLGEAAFRRAEGWELSRLLLDPASVIALGGGAFHSLNRNRIPAHAITVWLDVELPVAWDRCRSDPNRPLAASRLLFERLYQQRQIDYQNAQHRIQVDQQTPQELSLEIQQLLNHQP